MRVAAKTAYTSLRIILVYECNANVVYFDGVQLFTASGKRISKTVGGTTYNYHYLGDQLVEMAWGANRMHFTYDAVGPLSVNFNGTEYFYLKNAQGDVTGLVDSTGTKVVAYTYGPWGEACGMSGTLASTLGAINPLRYRGYVYDTETGLYYLNSRYYNPTWGRFINADEYLSAGENLLSTNVFAYCYCDPINLKDPNGNIAEAALIFTDLSAELIASIAAALGVTVIWVVGIILIVGVAELYSYVVRQANDSSFKDKTLSDVRPHIPDRSKVYQIAYINEQGSLIRLSTHYSYFEALAMLNCLGVYNNLRTSVDYNSSSYCAAHKKVNELGYSVWGIYTHYQVHAKALAVSIGVVTPPKVHGSGKYGHYNDSGHSLHIWFGGMLNY